MPIRPELREFYGEEWQTVTRPRILERAGNKCEQCRVPNYALVVRYSRPEFAGWWFNRETGEAFDNDGQDQGSVRGSEMPDDYRLVPIVLTVAHLNQTPGDDRDENLKALCQHCHLKYDSEQHARNAKETRLRRKEQIQPLLFDIETAI